MRPRILANALVTCAIFALAACGGGGGGGASIASTPPPPPPPSGSNAVEIFPAPSTQQFAVLGSGDPIEIRYDAAANRYEVMAGAFGWEALVDDPLASPLAGHPNLIFDFAGAPENQSYFMIRAHYQLPEPSRYQYSNLAVWGRNDLRGTAAFGMATPAGSVPMSGSASYQGLMEGVSTVLVPYEDALFNATVDGTVSLNFDFASGTLAGQINPRLYTLERVDLPALTFTNTVFGAGGTGFSGRFATGLAGPNAFSGLFTGPQAQELIGRWAFPFISPADGALASAQGAWIAKKP